jgi:hypothetical protein
MMDRSVASIAIADVRGIDLEESDEWRVIMQQ